MSSSLAALRTKHPWLRYDTASWHITDDGMAITWHFTLAPDIAFTTTVVIPGITEQQVESLSRTSIDTYILHMGLVESLSYWKTACPPQLKIAAGYFSPQELQWWHHLLLNGLGEFFYVNQIEFAEPGFVSLILDESVSPTDTDRSDTITSAQPSAATVPNRVIVPMGGGKDSAVTLQLVKQLSEPLCVLINPTPAARDVTHAFAAQSLEIKRTLDPKLIELNNHGYLNGHVPISAVYAWLTTLVGYLHGITEVLVSNERSSNEGNVFFQGQDINHQYSKSFAFEQGFGRYLMANPKLSVYPKYFSFLRPLYELQIAQLFVRQLAEQPTEVKEGVLHSFRSCNRGQKQNRWCGECPKCLFAFTILYPFLPTTELEILFGKNLFATTELIEMALELVGARPQKPLECVGTREENTVAFSLCVEKVRHEQGVAHANEAVLPPLLSELQREFLQYQANLPERAQHVLTSWNTEHLLSPVWEKHLRQAVIPAATP